MREAAASHPAAEVLEGRGRVYVVPAGVGEGRWVVRPYRRGGALASWLGDRYLRLGEPRPVREFEVGRAIEALEVPTPSHVGALVYPRGPWYRGDLVTEWVPASRDLAGVLFEGDPVPGGPRPSSSVLDPERVMGAAGALVRLLHDRGVVHRDLNLKNILITRGRGVGSAADAPPAASDRPVTGAPAGAGPRALVLDLDRATVVSRVGERERRRMLARFWRSARKWESATGRVLDPALRAAFEAGYRR